MLRGEPPKMPKDVVKRGLAHLDITPEQIQSAIDSARRCETDLMSRHLGELPSGELRTLFRHVADAHALKELGQVDSATREWKAAASLAEEHGATGLAKEIKDMSRK